MIGPSKMPDVDLDVPVASLAAGTRREEARAAMALVAALVDCGISPSDVTVVVRDIDPYEEPLTRAARRYGVTPTFWTQLRLKRTLPYQLTVATIGALTAVEAVDSGEETSTDPKSVSLDIEPLLAPLKFEWCPPAATDAASSHRNDTEWPIDQRTVATTRETAAGETGSLSEWCGQLVKAGADDRILTYGDWLADQPMSPTADELTGVLLPILEAYREVVLPKRHAADDATLTETARTARALARLAGGDGASEEGLVGECAGKYADWLGDGYAERSWATVAELVDAIATTVPGRREYATARSVDVMEANDTWGLNLPFVIAVGLVDGEWPRPPESCFPAAVRERLRGTEGPASGLRPRSGWTEGRELDQFVDTLRAASEGLILTRFQRDADGVETLPSPYLVALNAPELASEVVAELTGPDRVLPDELAAMLDDSESTTTYD
jgi:ATP-dependent helicase/nuclease subunit B